MEHNLERAQVHSTPRDYLTPMLALLGVVASVLAGAGVILKADTLKGLGTLFAVAYSIVLSWWLARGGLKAHERPDISPVSGFFRSYSFVLGLIGLLAVSLFVMAGVIAGNGWMMVPWSTPAAFAVLIVLRKQVSWKVILAGIITAAALFLVERILQPNDPRNVLINALLIAFQAMAGIVLLNQSGLSIIQLYDGHILESLRSLGWGCLFALPPALFNIASFSASNPTSVDLRFDQWWKAFYALKPGIVEETWARLFLLTLLYSLLRATSKEKLQRALTTALILSVFIHGLAHYPQSLSSPVSAIIIALMYGVPLGLIFIKRDFESAVAYHFLI